MGIAAAIVSTAVVVIGAGEVFSITAACLGAALLSNRITLAVDHVTVVVLDLSRQQQAPGHHPESSSRSQ